MPDLRPLGSFRGSKQVARAYAKSGGNLVERNNRWVSTSLFETADVLLAESRDIGELLLGQALFLSKAPHVPAHQSAHVHAQRSADYILRVYQL